MDIRFSLILGLTFLISFIGTISYSVRIVGVRTKKIAISFSLFNVLILFSRVANTAQAPMLTKYIEAGLNVNLISAFYTLILTSVIATIAGILFIPSFQRILSRLVYKFSIDRSVIKLVINSCTRNSFIQFKNSLTIPKRKTITQIKMKSISIKILFYNTFAVALIVVGSLAPVYAGTMNPELRATCLSLSGVINGSATVLSFIFIDPYLSILTDDVIVGKCSHSIFRNNVVALVLTKLLGTALAIPLLYPASKLIVSIALHL